MILRENVCVPICIQPQFSLARSVFFVALAVIVMFDDMTNVLAFQLAVRIPTRAPVINKHAIFQSSKGFGSSSAANKIKKKKHRSLKDFLDDTENPLKNKKSVVGSSYKRSEQEDLIDQLTARASQTALGQAVLESPHAGTPDADPFWSLIPSLIMSRFPNHADEDFKRVAGFLKHVVNPDLAIEDEITDPFRPTSELHAYMPGLGPPSPFLDPNQLNFCRELSNNYKAILSEYEALMADIVQGGKDRFQSVTSMNYDAGWKTLVLFYNGHKIPDFPYHLCPTTTRLLQTMPLAGRIAGFNRQQPKSGIPMHTDGNNMWLTTQMGIKIPPDNAAWIRVGAERRHWKQGECLLYDTTFEHETMNEHPTEERVVLHVDFFNTLTMTPLEIEVMQYIYSLREEFLKAEGVSKVGSHIL